MIILYKCHFCHNIFDEELIRKGWRCECQSMMFTTVVPSRKNIRQYIFAHPIHAIKRLLTKESNHE